MRVWHYKLIQVLPNSQLVAQWRELNSIFKKQDNHILINYVYEYPKENLACYTIMVMIELEKRGFKIKSKDNLLNYFTEEEIAKARNVKVELGNPFPKHHNDRYLRQCFYNLEEKYDRGQKDFSELRYQAMSYYLKEMGVIK